MRKYYSEPELKIRTYSLFQGDVLTVSTPEVGGGTDKPNLDDDDVVDPFA